MNSHYRLVRFSSNIQIELQDMSSDHLEFGSEPEYATGTLIKYILIQIQANKLIKIYPIPTTIWQWIVLKSKH